MYPIATRTLLDPLALTYPMAGGGELRGGDLQKNRRKAIAARLHLLGVTADTLEAKVRELHETKAVDDGENEFKKWFMDTYGPNGAEIITADFNWGKFQYPGDVDRMADDIRTANFIADVPPNPNTQPQQFPTAAEVPEPEDSRLQAMHDLGQGYTGAPRPQDMPMPKEEQDDLRRQALMTRLEAVARARQDIPKLTKEEQDDQDYLRRWSANPDIDPDFDSYDTQTDRTTKDDGLFLPYGDDAATEQPGPSGLEDLDAAAQEEQERSAEAEAGRVGEAQPDPGGTSITNETTPTGDPALTRARPMVPTNTRPGGTMTQWGIQSYGVIPNPSPYAVPLRETAVAQHNALDQSYVRPEFAPQELYFDTPVVGPAPYLGGIYA